MDVRITKISIQHFKGVQELTVEMNGQDTTIYGQNASGKTTVFDAFTWCLFGKDSADKTDFWVKPHDENGNEIHNLETIVEVCLTVNGKPLFFRHKVAENWVKKNGEADRVYSGNTHSYWVNGVARPAAEYNKTVGQIVSPEVFRLITNPMAFNAADWKKRREFLLKLSPVDVDAVMLARTEYQPIREAIDQYRTDIDGVRKVKNEERKKANAELEQIPVRISEQTGTMAALGTPDVAAAKQEIAAIDKRVEEIETALNSGADVIQQIKTKAEAVAAAESKLRDAKMVVYRAWTDAKAKVTSELFAAKAALRTATYSKADVEKRIADAKAELAELGDQIRATREKWYEIDEEKMPEYTGSNICPVCGQEFPAEQIEQARAKFAESYEIEKINRLNEISRQGIAMTNRVKMIEERLDKDTKDLEKLNKEIANAEKRITGLEAEEAAFKGEPDYSTNEEIRRWSMELNARQIEYQNASSTKVPADENLLQEKRDLIARKNELTATGARQEQLEICKKRIEQLEKLQKEIGIQVADTEQFIMLLDRFVAERCGMLEESINSLFPTVRWSLFERQINGGLKDACVCLIGGVQFSDANNAARINAGLEIIGVLSKHYGVTVPVFIDNAEAVNRVQEMDAQRVALVVTLYDKELRVEAGISTGTDK